MARNKMAKKTTNDTGVSFEFADGRTLAFNVSDASVEIRTRAMVHGFSQKIGDSYASAETVDEAYDAAVAVIDGLTKGSWSTRAPSEGGAGKPTMLIEGLYEVFKSEGKTIEEVSTLVESMDEEQRKAAAKLPPVAAAISAIRARRAAEKAGELAKKAAGVPVDLSMFTA